MIGAIFCVKIQRKKGVKFMELSKEARQAQNNYLKDWRRKNKDKVARHKANYWERVALKKAQEIEDPENSNKD
jgi:hypothetical protein